MKKKENESVKEFDTIFDNLLKQIPDDISAKDGVSFLQYAEAFEGKFGSMLRDKSQKNLIEAQECVTNIEENILVSKVDPCHAPRANAKTKPRTLNNVEPTQDPVILLSQRLDQMTIEFLQSQNILMNKVTNLRKSQ
jgi:hypothetical protein